MKKRLTGFFGLMLILGIVSSGCSNSSQAAPGADSSQPGQNTADEAPSSDVTELIVRFGTDGEPFTMYLEDNSTAAAIAGYVGTTDWQLPIYHYDESDVMQYYDIPSRYDIPDNSETVTEAHAGEVFYSDPNRIVLYYRDADISEEYTKIGTFEATDAFIAAVETNPVLEGWGNQLVLIGSK